MVSLYGVQPKDAGDLDTILDGTEIVVIQTPAGGVGSVDHTTTQAIADLGGGGGGGAVDSVDGQTGVVVLSGVYQPIDSDLTAIAALTTTSFGRGLLALADAAAARSAIGLTAANVPFTPNGSIAATDVQAAIQEVRDEAGSGSLTDAVILAPLTSERNVIEGTGDVTPLTLNAEAGQTAPLLDLNDENGDDAFTLIAPRPYTNAEWVIDGDGLGTPIDADAGSYQVSSPMIDPRISNGITVTVGDSLATIQAAFDAICNIGDTNLTLSGTWDLLTITTVVALGLGYVDGLIITNPSTLTKLGSPIADPVATNTIVGNDSVATLLGPYGVALGKAKRASGTTAYLFNPNAVTPEQSGYIESVWSLSQYTERVSAGPFEGPLITRSVSNDGVSRIAGTINEANSDGANFISADVTARIDADGTNRAGSFVLSFQSTDAWRIELDDTQIQETITMVAGQTAAPLVVKNSSGTVLCRIMPNGAVISNAHAAPADGDLNNSDFAAWLDDTAGAAKLHFKAKDSVGAVFTWEFDGTPA